MTSRPLRVSRIAVPALFGALLAARPVDAQPAGAPPAQPADTADTDKELGPGKDAIKEKPDALRTALAPQPGGLTFAMVAEEANKTSVAVRAKEIELEASEGTVTQTTVAFFPRLQLNASYTRLSEIDNGSLGGGAIVGAGNEGLLRTGPCVDDPTQTCVVDSAGGPVAASAFSFPSLLNQISFSANLTVPISDYFLRAVQAYNGAQHNTKSLEMAVQAQRLTVSADAKLVLLNWILAKGQVVVTQQSVEQSKAQLADAKALRKAEKGSDADVMRIEALVAQAELTEADAKSQEIVAEQRLRTTMHAPQNRPLAIGVDVFADPAQPALPSDNDLFAEAIRSRLEILSAEEQKKALEEVESTTAAGYFPRLDGFADAVVANPNQRIFPQQEQFDFTWDVGVRLTWVVNDTFSTIGAAQQARARTAQVDAQKQQLIDSVRIEVTQARADVAKAAPSIEAAKRGVTAAEEALRINKLLFAVGSGTGTALADAENAVTSARLRKLSAHVGLYAALVRLEHATGRDRAPAALASNAMLEKN